MTYNKKCFYKSLTHDFTIIGLIVLELFSIVMGAWLGYSYKDIIINGILGALSVIHIPASFVISVIIIAIAALMLWDLAFWTVKSALSDLSTIFMITMYIILDLVIFFVLSLFCMLLGSTIFESIMIESIPAIILVILMLIVGCPFAIAYVKCKDE